MKAGVAFNWVSPFSFIAIDNDVILFLFLERRCPITGRLCYSNSGMPKHDLNQPEPTWTGQADRPIMPRDSVCCITNEQYYKPNRRKDLTEEVLNCMVYFSRWQKLPTICDTKTWHWKDFFLSKSSHKDVYLGWSIVNLATGLSSCLPTCKLSRACSVGVFQLGDFPLRYIPGRIISPSRSKRLWAQICEISPRKAPHLRRIVKRRQATIFLWHCKDLKSTVFETVSF